MTVAEITWDGRDRTVKLPGDFFPGESKVYVNKIGNSVVLIPYHDSWKSLFDSLNEFSEDFMENRDQPKEQVRDNIF
jgi:antitoxin VapB